MKYLLLLLLFTLTTGCGANLSGLFTLGGMGSAVASKNSVSIAYSTFDLGVMATTDKNIREHALIKLEEHKKEDLDE
jgi:hypothetical protein|tara:strand:+ start:106086 stop:106316 length:231 start_codon:yes stop_codon:yes gene_type:complete